MNPINNLKNTNERIKERGNFRGRLTEENRDYFDHYLAALSADSTLKNRKSVDELIDTVLSDVLLAQGHGESAESLLCLRA